MLLSSSKIEAILQLEGLLVLVGLALVAYVAYLVVLRGLREDRNLLLKRLFKNLAGHLIFTAALFGTYKFGGSVGEGDSAMVSLFVTKLLPYFGLFTIISGSIVFVKTARIITFEYLFFVSMKAGVPVLLVNILSLALSLGLASWIATEVFGIRLVPVLATSALISVILGLALQDTLGNLFSGVALQLDKPYEIGDWVEISGPNLKWMGQIQEITWRSTVLLGVLDELITIPNRVIGQSEVVTWGAGGRHFWKGVSYRIPFGQPIEQVRKTLLETVSQVPGVRKLPAPVVYLSEVGESWLNFRVVFTMENYGEQFRVNDRVNSAVMEALIQSHIPVATPAMRVQLAETKG